jgi:hypothetical protein
MSNADFFRQQNEEQQRWAAHESQKRQQEETQRRQAEAVRQQTESKRLAEQQQRLYDEQRQKTTQQQEQLIKEHATRFEQDRERLDGQRQEARNRSQATPSIPSGSGGFSGCFLIGFAAVAGLCWMGRQDKQLGSTPAVEGSEARAQPPSPVIQPTTTPPAGSLAITPKIRVRTPTVTALRTWTGSNGKRGKGRLLRIEATEYEIRALIRDIHKVERWFPIQALCERDQAFLRSQWENGADDWADES